MACADYRALAVGIEEHGGTFVDGQIANLFRAAILQNSCHEDQRAAHAIAGGEVCVGDHVFQKWIGKEVVRDGDSRVEGIG